MERLTYKNESKREMICRWEDCDTCEEYCPHLNEDNCPCLQKVLEKLAEYEDLEEQGKLLKLPCVVGDTVYRVSRNGIYIDSCQITGFAKYDSIKSMCYTVYIDPDEEDIIAISDFGKTVFLTQEEADAALKKR